MRPVLLDALILAAIAAVYLVGVAVLVYGVGSLWLSMWRGD